MSTFQLNNPKIKYCTTFKDRLIGMMFQRKKTNFIYCFPKCKSVHTFFMSKNIDIIMTDKDKNILYYYKCVRPWKIFLPKKKVYYIYEFDTSLLSIDDFNKIKL